MKKIVSVMRNKHKNFLTFLPLLISVLVCFIYCSLELCVLRPKGLSWRPYITTGMFAIITLGLMLFFILLGYKLLIGLKKQRTPMKILRLVSVVVIGCITLYISACGLVLLSLTYTHEKVIVTDETRYISCLSDWNPVYYHYHEYDSWFTMVDEPFESIKTQNIDN